MSLDKGRFAYVTKLVGAQSYVVDVWKFIIQGLQSVTNIVCVRAAVLCRII